MNKGKLFVISGPSGVGKGTVKANLFNEFGKCLVYSISATTRAPRQGEEEGKDYFFIAREEFIRRIENNEFLEHAEFSGNMYGTPRNAVMRQLEAGQDVVLEIEVNGAMQVMEKMPECISIFILPPSFEVLEARLRGRGTESPEVVERRLAQARREIPLADKYQYQIVNNTIEDAYQELKDIYLRHSSVVHDVYNV